MDPTSQSQPQAAETILDLWSNLPPVIKGTAIAGVVTYLITVLTALVIIQLGLYASLLVILGLFVWPLILVIWLVVIWAAIAVFSAASVLLSGETRDKKHLLLKTLIFIPAVIGAALTVVEVFVRDIFE